MLKISDEELYFDAPISMKGLSKLRSDVPMFLTLTFSYLLLGPKEEHFSQYLEGPHSPVACLLSSQLPNQQMAVGSAACFLEVHGPLCYKAVLGHVEPPVIQSHAVDFLVPYIAEGHPLDSDSDVLNASPFHLETSVINASW